ncbi:hypothetical protein BDZ89DRAFT_1129851 [Hymenopellis radicata]|nr:hypothetical protein BDZ89DRAFT_1129851 [Hymenopellis radicata]
MSLFPEDDHLLPLYDGPVPCYGATLGSPDSVTYILDKFARTDCDSISPDHRAMKTAFMQMDYLPTSLVEKQLFCYTRFPLSQDELDRLAAFQPWYKVAEHAGGLARFAQAFKFEWNDNMASISENEGEALLFRLKWCLFATAQRTESSPPPLLLPPESVNLSTDDNGEWERLAGYNDFQRLLGMRRNVSEAHAELPEVAQWISAVDRREAKVVQYRHDTFWFGRFVCRLDVPASEGEYTPPQW